MKLTYINRQEHQDAGDYSGPVKIGGHFYRVAEAPIFGEGEETATVNATLLPDPTDDPHGRT